MATWADLLNYKQYVVRSDGAKFVDGVRNDLLDTSWLTLSPTVSLGPGLYDELMVLRRIATKEEIEAWAQAQAPWYDPSPVIDAGAQNVRAKGTGGAIDLDEQGIRATRYSDGATTLHFDTGTGNLAIAADLTGSAGDFANGKVRIGDIAGKPWGDGTLPSGTAGIWGEGAGLYLRDYARLLMAGSGMDEDTIDLSGFPDANNPEILVAPREVITYAPAYASLTYVIVDAVKDVDDDNVYHLKAKCINKGDFHSFLKGQAWTPDSWTLVLPSDYTDGKRGVYTDFFVCRPVWEVNRDGGIASLSMDITDKFDANGNPINWTNVRTFSRSTKGAGTLYWDLGLPRHGQWALRVSGSGSSSTPNYGQTGISYLSLGWRDNDRYIDADGTEITTDDPANTPSGLGLIYFVFDQG